jgi:HAD superfamily hydrolase (TIGR01490 family)
MAPDGTASGGRGGAFFDLDRTLMAGSSGMHFARAAYRSGMVGRGQMVRWGIQHLHFRLRGATEATTEELLEQVKVMLRGVPERDVARTVPDLMAGLLPRIYPQMLDEVHAHQDAGRPTFIISGAGNGLVELLARVLGMEGGIGTRYEVDPNGAFTGELEGPLMYGEGKVEAMRRFAADHDLDLDASWAYSDSASDLPMLSLVGTPVAVNPDPELARVVRERGWRTMSFERLGRRLAVGATVVAAGAIGGSGTWLAARRRPRRRATAFRRGGR